MNCSLVAMQQSVFNQSWEWSKGLICTCQRRFRFMHFKQCVIDECYAIVTSVIAETYTLQLFQSNNFVITIFLKFLINNNNCYKQIISL